VTSQPILYSFRRCPYAMRARLALIASNTPCELREIVLRDYVLRGDNLRYWENGWLAD
jgi:hypothetical protein